MTVLADGKLVGRIYEQGSIGEPPELRWFWSITIIVPVKRSVMNGHAATREEGWRSFATLGRRPWRAAES
jgi:hypothetical protein